MSNEPKLGVPLTCESLYRIIADEICKDGVVESQDILILEKAAIFLHLAPEEARRIAREAWNNRPEMAGEEKRPLDPHLLYATVLRFARSDDEIDHLEEQMLAGLRKLFCISEQEHDAILREQSGEETKERAAPKALDVGKAPRVSIPTPGSTTGTLSLRLDHDPLEAWTEDHRFWYPIARSASDPAREAWETFLRGMTNGDQKTMYAGLDALDDLLNTRGEIMAADALLGLAVLRWSRVLLRTTFSSAEDGEARHWPGMNLYTRLCVKVLAILISLEHLPRIPAIEKGIAMAFVFLLEDLCMLVRCRHAEPIEMLATVIPMVAKISPKSQVMHQAVELFGLLTTMTGRQGGELASAYVAVCREICRAMPQNHPLALATHVSILTLAPKNAVFPANYQVRANTSSSPSCPQAVQRLERLIAETRSLNEEERLLIEALSRTDLKPIDEILSTFTASYREQELDPEMYLFRNLVAMIFPALPEIPRPVVAFFSLGTAGGHHEEMKGGWLPVLLKKTDENRLQAIPDFPLFASTSFMSVPLGEKDAEALSDALDRSGGAYDVVLIDPGRRGARIWHQAGDLDPSGNLYRVERKLLPAEQLEEAEHCLDQALVRHPWMSGAWMRKGVLAKGAGNLKAAREAFDKAVAVQPHDPHSLARLGVLDKVEHRMESSERMLRAALQILPTNPSAIITLASLALGRLVVGENTALPLWDYNVAGLYAGRGDGPDFREIADASFDPGLVRKLPVTPVDTVFYL